MRCDGRVLTGAALALALVTGCSSGSSQVGLPGTASGTASVAADGASPSGSTSASPSTSSPGTSSPGASSPSASSLSPTGSVSPSGSPTPHQGPWTQGALKAGLLTLKDLPAGYRIDTSGDSAGPPPTSRDRGCAAFLAMTKDTSPPPGTQAVAKAGFIHSPQGPLVSQELDGMPSAAAARSFLTRYAKAARTCPSLQMTIAAGGVSTAAVKVLPPLGVGDQSVVVQITIVSGPGTGVSITTVGVATGRVISGLTYSFGSSSVVTSLTKVAVRKVQTTLVP